MYEVVDKRFRTPQKNRRILTFPIQLPIRCLLISTKTTTMPSKNKNKHGHTIWETPKRTQAIIYHKEGFSYREIEAKTKVPRSTLSDWFKKGTPQPRRPKYEEGRPQLLTERDI
jgi:hypothetical protein